MMLKKYFSTLVAVAALLCIGLFSFGSWSRPMSAQAESPYKELKLFTDVLSIIRQSYVEEVDSKELLYGGIKGMMSVLDPHSAFMPPDVYREMQTETKGEFGGVGIEISLRDGILTVVTPIEDTPAFRAGLLAGDRIVQINGTETSDFGLMDAVKQLRGKPGTKVDIGVMRTGLTAPRIFTLEREIIKIESIKFRSIDQNIGYVRISRFQENTDVDLKEALATLHRESREPFKGLVIDLRNNPGGLLDQAVKVSDVFLERGLIVYTEGRDSENEMKFTAHQSGTEPLYPIVVLINAGSASAAEIVAGALQDHQRAIILGTRSFGKGSVQTIMGLSDNSGLRLTTARYFTPSGRSIQATGIVPDVVVAQTAAAEEATTPVVRENDLKNHFQSDKKEPLENRDKESREADRDKNDAQLMRALDLLKGWTIFNRLKPQAA